jgi:hypothetical protein
MTSVAQDRIGEGADAPCPSGKIRFATSADADAELENVRACRRSQGGVAGHERRVRHCTACAGWHLTSKRLVATGEHKAGRAGKGARRRR